MLKCEGYMMYQGRMTVTPKATSGVAPFVVRGTFLFRPDTNCWYYSGDPERGSGSFHRSICSGFVEVM